MSKPDYPHPLIAREGWPFLAIAVVLALGASLFWSAWLAGLLWIAALFVLQFFRDPPREVPGDALTVVSPADGRVVVVEKARDPYLDRDAIKVLQSRGPLRPVPRRASTSARSASTTAQMRPCAGGVKLNR